MKSLAAIFLLATSLSAQSVPDDAFLDALFAVRTFNDVAISPDGKRVAWTEKDHGVWVANADGSKSRQLTTANDEGIAWSPDSRSLAYLAKKNDQKQLYVDGRQLTNVKGAPAEPRWSPDGKSVAFLFIENSAREAGPLVAMSRAVGVIQEHIDEQRVAVVDLATKKLRIVTPPDMYVYHFDWSPDSRRLVVEAAPGSGDNNYWIAQLHVVDVASATMTPLYKPQLQLANPRWSPDGRAIAFIEGLMSDEGQNGGDLFVIRPDGTGRRNLTPNAKSTVTSFEWTSANEVIAGVIAGGDSVLSRIRLDGTSEVARRGVSMVTTGRVVGLSVARDGRTSAVIHHGVRHAPEIWTGPIGDWKQITRRNTSAPIRWGEPKDVRWKNGPFDLQGWLMTPANVDPARKYPMIVYVHGGPASAILASWPRDNNAFLAAHGYYVFMPNFRGSYGQGEEFTKANVKDFGHGDLSDILAGVDAVLESHPIDPARLGMWGWSYGGFMSMWTVTQTGRFKAAVAGAGIANWQSYYGQNHISEWMIPYFGASVYDDPAVYARSAPITYIKNVRTPTLVLVGERDGECPAPQSFEFWHALKTHGVPTQLVVYPDEGHAFRKPEHKRDLARRLVQWFDDHLR
jgi:dipeptidyl aminopeptidase/acylaminoacyl peptidase